MYKVILAVQISCMRVGCLAKTQKDWVVTSSQGCLKLLYGLFTAQEYLAKEVNVRLKSSKTHALCNRTVSAERRDIYFDAIKPARLGPHGGLVFFFFLTMWLTAAALLLQGSSATIAL